MSMLWKAVAILQGNLSLGGTLLFRSRLHRRLHHFHQPVKEFHEDPATIRNNPLEMKWSSIILLDLRVHYPVLSFCVRKQHHRTQRKKHHSLFTFPCMITCSITSYVQSY